jgi:predicted DNA-binding transcriptional regulator YafY
MRIIEGIERIKRLDGIIRNRVQGSPQELAEKLGISRSVLYNYLDDLKLMGAEIKYNKKQLCFEYEKEFILKF